MPDAWAVADDCSYLLGCHLRFERRNRADEQKQQAVGGAFKCCCSPGERYRMKHGGKAQDTEQTAHVCGVLRVQIKRQLRLQCEHLLAKERRGTTTSGIETLATHYIFVLLPRRVGGVHPRQVDDGLRPAKINASRQTPSERPGRHKIDTTKIDGVTFAAPRLVVRGANVHVVDVDDALRGLWVYRGPTLGTNETESAAAIRARLSLIHI